MIRYIIFDLGNVLLEIHPEKIMRQFADRCQYSEQLIKSFYLSDLHLGFMEGNYSPTHFFHAMMKKFPCDIDQNEFRNIWNNVIGEPKPGISQLISELYRKYKLFVCSNTDPWHWKIACDKMPFIDHFNKFFLSYEMKINKPNLKIFIQILNMLEAKGEECLFIDDIEENTTAAKKLGFSVIQGSDPKFIQREMKLMNIL